MLGYVVHCEPATLVFITQCCTDTHRQTVKKNPQNNKQTTQKKHLIYLGPCIEFIALNYVQDNLLSIRIMY